MASDSTAQIKAFLDFFASKRQVAASELGAVFRDNQESRLLDDMYSKDEVEDMLAGLLMDVKEAANKELERTAKISALVLEQQLVAGSAAGVELTVDMSRAEDEGSLARVGTDASARLAEEATKRMAAVKLDSIRDEHAKLVADVQRLKEENETLKERYQTMQARATSAVKDVSQLTQDVNRLEVELSSAKAAGPAVSVTSAGKEREQAEAIVRLQKEVALLKSELEDAESARKEAESSVGTPVTQTKQFKQLKAMLDKKNEQLKDARRQLAKYEPDEADMADDSEFPSGK